MWRPRRHDAYGDRAVAAQAHAMFFNSLFSQSITPTQILIWLADVLGVASEFQKNNIELNNLNQSLCRSLSRKERDAKVERRLQLIKRQQKIADGLKVTAHGHLCDGGLVAFGQPLPIPPNAEYEALPTEVWHDLQLDFNGARTAGGAITYVNVRIARATLVLPAEERDRAWFVMKPGRRGYMTLRRATGAERISFEQAEAYEANWRSWPMWGVPKSASESNGDPKHSQEPGDAAKENSSFAEKDCSSDDTMHTSRGKKRGPRTQFGPMIDRTFDELRQNGKLPASRSRIETARRIYRHLKLKHRDLAARHRGLPALATIRKAMPKCYSRQMSE